MKTASLMYAMLLFALLAPSVAGSALFQASPDEVAGALESSLAAAGLEQSQVLSDILRELGLPSVQDVRLLNVPEQLELADSLRDQGVNLGSRSKLRRLSEKVVEPGDEPAPEETLHEKNDIVMRYRRSPPGSGRPEREGGQREQRRQLQSRGG